MPPDFVFVNRIQWGVYSLLVDLGATANWHLIDREYRLGAAPATELGRLDRDHRDGWHRARNLDGAITLTPDGPRLRPAPPDLPRT